MSYQSKAKTIVGSHRFPRVILAFDLDCFYASVHIRNDPSLSGHPVGIVQKHLVVTSNYIARSLGVAKMSPVKEALAQCPTLRLVDGSDLAPFRKAAKEVRAVIRSRLPHGTPIEFLGLDEVFVDASGAVAEISALSPKPPTLQGNVIDNVEDAVNYSALAIGTGLAAELRALVAKETQLTMCGGIGDSKLAAKVAAGFKKPDAQSVFLSGGRGLASFLSSRAPRAVPGFGRGYTQRLKSLHPEIETVRELLERFPPGTHSSFAKVLGVSGEIAEKVLLACRGIDRSPVVPAGPPKLISSEDSQRSINSRSSVREKLVELTREMVGRLVDSADEHGACRAETLQVKFRFAGTGYQPTYRSVPMPMSASSPFLRNGNDRFAGALAQAVDDIVRVALGVLDDNGLMDPPFVYTLLGVGATNFSRASSMQPRSIATSEAMSFRASASSGGSTISPPDKQETRRSQEPVTDGVCARSLPGKAREVSLSSCPVCSSTFPSGTTSVRATLHVNACLSKSLESESTQPKVKQLRARKSLTKAKTRHVGSFFTPKGPPR